MPKRSKYDWKQIKNVCYQSIKKQIDTPVLFRQTQFQSMICFLPGGIDYLPLKRAIDKENTQWHISIWSDDRLFQMAKNDKEKENATRNNSSKAIIREHV